MRRPPWLTASQVGMVVASIGGALVAAVAFDAPPEGGMFIAGMTWVAARVFSIRHEEAGDA